MGQFSPVSGAVVQITSKHMNINSGCSVPTGWTTGELSYNNIKLYTSSVLFYFSSNGEGV